jgi:hypothetical protein
MSECYYFDRRKKINKLPKLIQLTSFTLFGSGAQARLLYRSKSKPL